MKRRDHESIESGAPGSATDAALDPDRWSALHADGKLGAAFRALATVPVPDVPGSLPDRPGAVSLRRAGHRRSRLAFTLAALALAATAFGGALAATKVYHRLREKAASVPVASLGPSTRQARVSPRRLAPARAETTDRDEAPAVADGPPATDGEATLLAGAFRSLRADRNPTETLALLDAHDRQFPLGQLSGEANLARVEALLALGRRREALGVLERTAASPALEGGENARERTLLRGELRAEAGRCGQALADFASVERDAPVELGSRALWGQAVCHARLGEAASARRDFARYLAVYSEGTMARQARRWLTVHPLATTDAPVPPALIQKSPAAKGTTETFAP
jgi:hypothetical protein